MLETALYISLWAYLYTMPLSEPGQVFGWLRSLLFKWIDPNKEGFREALFKALIGCAKCHAGQVAFWWQVFCFCEQRTFSMPFILIAIAGAYALQTWHQIVETWLNR